MVARRFPQLAYAGFTQSLQAEWQYLSRCVPGVEKHLVRVKEAIRCELIPALLQVNESEVKDDLRRLLAHSVKTGGLNIRDPAAGAERLHQSSVEATKVLADLLLLNTELDLVSHKQCVRKAGASARKERVDAEKVFVKETMELAPRSVRKRLGRVDETGAWLTVTPNKLNGSLLSAEEWCDNACLRYGLRPVGLCDRCDGCGAGFTVAHGLSCKKGGLVGQRHDDGRDEAGELCALATTSSRISYKPKIFYGTDVTASQGSASSGSRAAGTSRSNAAGDEVRGDVLVHGLWKWGEDCVLNIRVTDTDSKSYLSMSSAKVLEKAAKEKKTKYLDACIERRRLFVPLVYSVDGMEGKEAKAFEGQVASLLASKMNRPYSEMCGFVRSCMALAIVRSNTLLLCGSRSGRALRPSLADGAAFELMGSSHEW
jgi:hypothetical protein